MYCSAVPCFFFFLNNIHLYIGYVKQAPMRMQVWPSLRSTSTNNSGRTHCLGFLRMMGMKICNVMGMKLCNVWEMNKVFVTVLLGGCWVFSYLFYLRKFKIKFFINENNNNNNIHRRYGSRWSEAEVQLIWGGKRYFYFPRVKTYLAINKMNRVEQRREETEKKKDFACSVTGSLPITPSLSLPFYCCQVAVWLNYILFVVVKRYYFFFHGFIIKTTNNTTQQNWKRTISTNGIFSFSGSTDRYWRAHEIVWSLVKKKMVFFLTVTLLGDTEGFGRCWEEGG